MATAELLEFLGVSLSGEESLGWSRVDIAIRSVVTSLSDRYRSTPGGHVLVGDAVGIHGQLTVKRGGALLSEWRSKALTRKN